MVDRYDLQVYSEGAAGQCDMELSENGGYVLYADYAALEAKLSAAENNEIDARCHVADLELRYKELAASKGKVVCPYCGGLGWREADVGQIFECMPCNQTGFVQ
jgi:hypothetical protein